MSTPCSVPGCKQPPFTPSGMKNFACKGWRLKQHDKQERIAETLRQNKEKAEKAKAKAFDLDRLVAIRNNLEKSEIVFDAKKYIETRDPDLVPKLDSVIKKFDALTKERKEIQETTADLKKDKDSFNIDVPSLFDKRAETTLKKVSDAIKNLAQAKNLTNVDNSNNDVFKELSDVIKIQSNEMEQSRKIIDSLLLATFKTEIGTLKEAISVEHQNLTSDIEFFDHCLKYRKYIRRKVRVKNTKTCNSYFICGDPGIAKYLTEEYPNVFYFPMKEYKMGRTNWKLSQDPTSSHRINILPDLTYIDESNTAKSSKFLVLDTKNYNADNEFQWMIEASAKKICFQSYFEFDIMEYFSGIEIDYSFSTDDLYETQDRPFDQLAGSDLGGVIKYDENFVLVDKGNN